MPVQLRVDVMRAVLRFWRGYWNALGLHWPALQIAIVAAGVGAILAASSNAFYAIKWFGVAYLIYLAIKQMARLARRPQR